MTHPRDLDFSELTLPERLLLAQQLLDSVLVEATPLSNVQIAEVRRRAAAIDAGEAECQTWDDVLRRLLPSG